MTQFLAEQRHWLEVSRLPAYAPELNPVEGLWSNLKSQELANRCETHMQMVTIAARQGANRVRSQRSLSSASSVTPDFSFDRLVTLLGETL